jgi:hypothetical protein
MRAGIVQALGNVILSPASAAARSRPTRRHSVSAPAKPSRLQRSPAVEASGTIRARRDVVVFDVFPTHYSLRFFSEKPYSSVRIRAYDCDGTLRYEDSEPAGSSHLNSETKCQEKVTPPAV